MPCGMGSHHSSRFRRLSPTAHGGLDYGLIAALAMAPAVFSPGTPHAAVLACYGVVFGWVIVLVFTRYPFGVFGAIALRVHGAIEALLGPLLIALPWLAGFADWAVARAVFIGAGVAALLLALGTDYRAQGDREAPHEPPVDRGAMPPRQAGASEA